MRDYFFKANYFSFSFINISFNFFSQKRKFLSVMKDLMGYNITYQLSEMEIIFIFCENFKTLFFLFIDYLYLYDLLNFIFIISSNYFSKKLKKFTYTHCF